MDIKLFRLQSGEDIITHYEYINNQEDMPAHYKITNPLKIVYLTPGLMSNKFMVSLLPWIFTSLTKDKEFILMPRDILTMANPSDKLLAYYISINTKINEMFEDIEMSDEDNEKTLSSFGGSVEEELDMMDENEEQLQGEEYLEMIRKTLTKVPTNKKRLH